MNSLRTHGRFPYSGIKSRADFEWPGGRRLACYIAVNLEHFAWGDDEGAKLAPSHGQPDVLNHTWREYGNRVGIWRLLDLFEAAGLPAAILVNTAIYDHCPSVMDACRAHGHEVVAHGHTNSERQGDMDEATERALVAATARTIVTAEGSPPRGWLGPWISESETTPDLLAEAGYTYLLDWAMDDQPVWLATRGGGHILSVPYPQEINDIPAITARAMSAADFCAMLVDQFDEMLEQSVAQPLVMGISLHPYIFGQPHRLRCLRRALDRIKDRAGVWWTTPGAIATAFAERVPQV